MQNRGLGEPLGNCGAVEAATNQTGKLLLLLLGVLRDFALQLQELFRCIAIERQYGAADLCLRSNLHNARRDAVPLFEGPGRRTLTDQDRFAPAHKVPRAE
jgi:hypothetical protein